MLNVLCCWITYMYCELRKYLGQSCAVDSDLSYDENVLCSLLHTLCKARNTHDAALLPSLFTPIRALSLEPSQLPFSTTLELLTLL